MSAPAKPRRPRAKRVHPAGAALLTARDLASWLGLSEQAVRRRARAGQIPTIKIGHQVLFPRVKIKAWLAGEDAE